MLKIYRNVTLCNFTAGFFSPLKMFSRYITDNGRSSLLCCMVSYIWLYYRKISAEKMIKLFLHCRIHSKVN